MKSLILLSLTLLISTNLWAGDDTGVGSLSWKLVLSDQLIDEVATEEINVAELKTKIIPDLQEFLKYAGDDTGTNGIIVPVSYDGTMINDSISMEVFESMAASEKAVRIIGFDDTDLIYEAFEQDGHKKYYMSPIKNLEANLPKTVEALEESAVLNGAWIEI